MPLTPEVLFINADFVKRYSHLNGSVEEAYMVSHIMIAQDKYVQSFLGTNLFEKLKSDIAGGTLSGNYQTLVDTYVRKVTLWWTMVEMIPSLYVRLDNGGLAVRTSEDTTPISKGDLNREIDRARNNAQFYTDRMIEYLCNNNSLFPEYSDSDPGDILPEKQAYYESGMEIQRGRMTNEKLKWVLDR